METHRRLGDPSNTKDTLLTLPLSDFPGNNNTAAAAAAAANNNNNETNNNNQVNDTDELILISIPSSKDNNGLTLDDLVNGKVSVYILGDTSEKDIHTHDSVQQQQEEEHNAACVGGSIEPVAARLIVEGKTNKSGEGGGGGKTMELTRVETSNTYIVVPPMPVDGSSNNNKRQKLDETSTKPTKDLVTMPARSIGLVPGEDSPSCFFLEPTHLKPGHFCSKLRGVLSRWMYDPFDPPAVNNGNSFIFGYTLKELAHICRTSTSEIEYAIHNRVFGAEDALALPSSSEEEEEDGSNSIATAGAATRYGMLSEEGRQTVATAIITILLESDLELVWKSSDSEQQGKKRGMKLSLLVEEVRTQWHNLEGNNDDSTTHRAAQAQLFEKQPHLTDSRMAESQNNESQSQFGTPSQLLPTATQTKPLQLSDEAIWHCLRPVVHYYEGTSATKDAMPESVQLLPDEVAKLAAHHVFVQGTPRSFTTSVGGAGSADLWDQEEMMEAWLMRLPSMPSKYEPKIELLKGIAISNIKEVNGGDEQATTQPTTIRQWQYFPEVGLPLVPSQRIKSMFAMRDVWTLEEAVAYLEKFIVFNNNGDGKEVPSMVADLLGKHAKVINKMERNENGKEVSVTKYVAAVN